MTDIIVIAAVVVIAALAAGYVIRAKRRGKKCIGCPAGGSCSGSCAGCAGGCEHTPMEELVALMKYMVGHNAAHAKELAELACKLDEAGNHAAYHKVMDAVACFEKGNEMLAEVLKDQQ